MRNHLTITPFKRAGIVFQAAVLASTALLPALLLSGSASAAQLQNRFVDMSSKLSSVPSVDGSGRDGGDAFGQDVTYTIGFDVPTNVNIGAIAVEFCSDSPILLDTCTAPTGMDVDTTGTVANQVGVGGFTKHALSDPNLFVISDGTPDAITSDTADTRSVDGRTVADPDVMFDIEGITNSTTTGTFYARITTYSSDADLPSATWVSTTTNATNGIGAYDDDGSVALAVANHLTVTARVQEVLQFCIGTETGSTVTFGTPTPAEDCGDVSGTALSLGVVDSNTVQNTNDGDIANDGVMLVRTNASDGVAIFYKSEQDTSSGKLKIAGEACSGTNLDDPCFNSAGTTAAAISAGTESFGMTLYSKDEDSGGATNNLTCTADYDGGTQACTGTSTPDAFAWDDTQNFDTIASSTDPVDDEKAKINFAATAAPTTPTGLYTVTANFVATATY